MKNKNLECPELIIQKLLTDTVLQLILQLTFNIGTYINYIFI